MDRMNDLINEKYENEYEEVNHAAELFCIPREFAVQLAILREVSQINMNFENWMEGRKKW